MKKILIVRFSSIGDIVLCSPIIRSLSQSNIGVLHFLTKHAFASLVSPNPYLQKVYSFREKIEEVIPSLKKEKYDFIIDLHKNIRSLKVRMLLGVKSFSYPKENLQKWILVNFKKNLLSRKHIVDRYFEALKYWQLDNDEKGLDFFIPSTTQVPFTLPHSYHVLVTGAAHFTKAIPINIQIDIIKGLQHPVVLLGGKKEIPVAQQIMAVLPHVINLTGKLDLHQSAKVLSQAKNVITPDTGMMHIAAAFKKQIFVVWGNTVPQFGMYPYKTSHVNLEIEHLNCRPCSKIGKEKCPQLHFHCMTLHSAERISEMANR